MDKQCEYTRRSLRKYLHGHLFKTQKIRIDRHLNQCVVCRSEFEALKQSEETKMFLKDITPPESVAEQVRDSLSVLARLKKIVYRPLWIAAIALIIAAAIYYVITPRRLNIEIENIVRTTSSSTAPKTAVQPAVPISSTTAAPSAATQSLAQKPAPSIEPFVVTITIEKNDESTEIRQLNEIMQGHAQLRKNKFSDDVRELSGSLTSKELLILFDRIAETAKPTYSRKRLRSFPSEQQIPFVLKLKTVTRAAVTPVPTEKTGQGLTEQPVEAEVPVQPATAPTPSSAQ